MITLKKYTGSLNLNEIFQSLDIKFAFVNNKNEQISMPAKCRDFLGDCIWSRVTRQNAYVYGFSYDYAVSPYYLRKTKLSLTFPNKDTLNNFMGHLDWLHKKEKKAKIVLTKVTNTDKKLTVVVEGSGLWQEHPWKIALYTYYLKCMSLDNPDEVTIYPESNYASTIKPKEIKLLKALKVKGDSTLYPTDIYTQHNSTGVISMLKSNTTLYNHYLGE